MRRRMLLTLAPALVLILAACGGTVSEREPHVVPSRAGEGHIVKIAMTAGHRFDPNQLFVAAGQTAVLEVTNLDGLPHELFIGDQSAQAAHARLSHNPGAALPE